MPPIEDLSSVPIVDRSDQPKDISAQQQAALASASTYAVQIDANSGIDWRVRVINATIDKEILRFMYPHPSRPDHHSDINDHTLSYVLSANVPPRPRRPISGRPMQTREAQHSLFATEQTASILLDSEHLCREAFRLHGETFPTSIWTCCQNICFATIATGTNPRFFALVKRVHLEISNARSSMEQTANFLQPTTWERRHSRGDTDNIRITSLAKEHFAKVVQKYLPVLLGKRDEEGISGKLCIRALRDLFGVSLNFFYRRRTVNESVTSLLDQSGSRQRALRRVNRRDGLTAISEMPSFECGCVVSCFADAQMSHIESLNRKFCLLSGGLRPYETENEFIIDLLYCPLTNADTSICDRAIGELLGVSSRRVSRARKVVLNLMSNPPLLLNEKRAPAHGMHKYSSENHPMNRVSNELRKAIAQGLDLATRADPSATNGTVTYRFYDPAVNSYEKIQKLLHRSMSETIGSQIGGLSSSTFNRIFVDYLAERDGRLSIARADHNCCPHCQELELDFNTAEMELKLCNSDTAPEIYALGKIRFEEARKALNDHKNRDRMVRGHLRKLVEAMRFAENDYRASPAGQNASSEGLMIDCGAPQWRSKAGLALLSHQDDMSKVDLPHFTRESLSTLTRYRFDVSAHVSAITGSAFVFSHEQGTGKHTSGTIFEGILLDHLLTCRGEGLKIVWSDCASVGRSFFLCIAAMQFLVDSGLCDLALSGYMANCHGKYLAESLFGQWKTRAKNEDMISVDALLNVFEEVKRAGEAKIIGLALNPVSAVNWQENLTRLGYATSPPPDFGWEFVNPHYACACRPGLVQTLSADLKKLLEPLMPKYENCVRVSSWPYFDDPRAGERIPFEHRPIDVPALARNALRRTGSAHPSSASQSNKTDGSEWYLVVPKEHPYAPSGDGVVSKATAEVVGHNSSGFSRKVAILKDRNNITKVSWPEDMELPPSRGAAESVKVAPENWIARHTVMAVGGKEMVSRYPPLNMLNALEARPPREKRQKHKFTATYKEPPFPTIQGTCAYPAVLSLAEKYDGKWEASLNVLDLYKYVRSKMGVTCNDEVDRFLQPFAKSACVEAVSVYQAFLRENKARNKGRPVRKRTAYQIFRADKDVKEEMKILLSERKRAGDVSTTLPGLSLAFWEGASAEFKKKYDDLEQKEDQRYEREFAKFLEQRREHDDRRDGIVR